MSITEKVKYLKSVLRFLAVITVIIASVYGASSEERNSASFTQAISYYTFLPQITNPFPPKLKTLSLMGSYPFWNGRFLDATKKLRKIKKNNGPSLINGTIIMYHRYENNDLQIPALMTIEWYRSKAVEKNIYHEFQKNIIKKIKKKDQHKGGKGKGITLIDTQIGKTDVELSINGNISVSGDLVFEDKDLITTNQKESKNMDLEIEQTQRFNINGNIGNHFFIDIKQDSEADFTWENDLSIEYKGEKNDILQKAEAGNINLSLEGMDAINLGGENSSLFGFKAVNQLGPVEIQSVIAMEQVKKAEKTMTGGMETGEPTSIKDYNFIVDRYFFIDETFRNNFYPLDHVTNTHKYYTDYVIGKYEVYQKVTTAENDLIQATAYLDMLDIENSYNISGSWKRLEENVDYEIDRILGYIRLNSTQDAIAISYTITSYNPTSQIFNNEEVNTGTNFKTEYVECITTNEDNSVCEELIKLKLLKDINTSSPNSPTWPLMFKNVYSLGGSNIDPNGLEVEIVRNLGGNDERTHTDVGNSFLSIFRLDSEDQNHQKVPDGCDNITYPCTGDGKIDLYGSILNLAYGELLLPAYMPFAFDSGIDEYGNLHEDSYWGNSHIELNGILVELNDFDGSFIDESDTGPAMYYDTNQDKITEEHAFIIKVKTSSKSSSMSLGFMIVEDSETVRLGNQVLQKDVDYTIDYFSGTINFISQEALDPTAEISVSYEENELISFDQKFLLGSHMKYTFGEKNYLAGGMFYYNQDIADEKVEIGYEPMRNLVWNIKGKYQNEWGFLTQAVDFLPLIQTTKPSLFSIEGNYAEINPNPNPLGQAFIDDFESAKRTSSLSIMQRQWKMASPSNDTTQVVTQTIENRGRIIWYNPYEDEATKNIWPEQSTSTRANNNTTKTLHLQTEFQGNYGDTLLWNGIMTPLYSSEYDQSLTKYLDIWLNAEEVKDDSLLLYVDIGHISEDWNDNGKLDTEDEPVYGPGMGDGILSDGEDIGVDNCTDSYENGLGGCLCEVYDEARYDSNHDGIINHTNPTITDRNGRVLREFCIDQEAVRYSDALLIAEDYPDSIIVNSNANENDPNGDKWSYTEGSNDYSFFNGTEGNGQAMGYRYPDTEDMDKNNTLNTRNDYFTYFFNPTDTIMMVTETKNNNNLTGWKLFRIPLTSFVLVGTPKWNDVRSFRLRVESSKFESDDIQNNINLIKIAKIEMVENDWQELGIAHKDKLNELNDDYDYFSVEVINTDESTEYKNSLNDLEIVREHDEYNDIYMKEQSLVLSFIHNPNDSNDADSADGLAANHAALIKNIFPSLSNDKSQSYFAYEKMKMFVYGGDPAADPICHWCSKDSSDVDFLFRFGKDNNNYYEIRQPVYKGWNDNNHVDINISKLTKLKIPIIDAPHEELSDVGLDGCADQIENGYGGCLDTLTFSYYCNNVDSLLEDNLNNYIMFENCTDISSDPNNDNYHIINNPNGTEDNDEKFDYIDINGDGLITEGEAEPAEEDYNGDGIYTPHPSYDYENDIYVWNNKTDIKDACNNCSELRIKGTPSINNIKNIIMGVINNSDDRIYGKVLVNELRMTGVKKKKGRSYNVSGSLDFADLMTVSGNYNRKDSDFHKLQQRLGTGNSDESYSATIKLHPNIILPTRWGIKTPVTLGYSNSFSTPKYHPGSDILTDQEDINIDELQTISEKISFSTSLNKSSRSTNWILKRTIDNIALSYSVIKTNKSNNQILKHIKQDYEASGNYIYAWGKENYFSPFGFTKDWILIGSILGEARYYYTPDKFSAKVQFNESDSRKIQRVNVNDTTKTYSFNMSRKFSLNHKFTKTISSNYSKQIDSNFPENEFRYNKWKIIEEMDPGLVKATKEKLTNTYVPDFLQWMNPNITYNPSYNWDLNINDTENSANIKSSNTFKVKIGLSIKDFIELIYTPDNKGKSSSRGRGRSSSSKKNDKINIKNTVARFVLGKFHYMASRLNKISATYTYTTSHEYKNISADLSPSYLYRLGLQKSPFEGSSAVEFITTDNLVGSSADSYGNDFNTSTSISVTKSIVTNLDFKYSTSLSIPSTSSITENESFSYYSFGNRGDDGFPITNWSVNWSKIEKWWFFDKLFKSINLNHGFNGEQSMTYKDSVLQNEQYSFSYSPVIGLTTKTRGRSPITFKAHYNLNQTIKNVDESTERNHKKQISSTISFKKSGGIRFGNLFFFRDFYIPNDMDFSLNFIYDIDRKLMTSTRVTNIDDFNEQSNNTSWSLKPNVTYNFTRWVNGNFYFVYGISENKTSGRNEEKDFGFNLNIKIQG